MDRRRVLRTLSFGSTGLMFGCSPLVRSEQEPHIIPICEDVNQIKNAIDEQYYLLKKLSKGEEETIQLEIGTTPGSEIILLEFIDNEAADYRHLRLKQNSTGKMANVF